eukprot:m.8914 g.8914  ORF g.8914 m.8914 type:complete len:200 (+) comp3971_c0_seq1:148-747(+)
MLERFSLTQALSPVFIAVGCLFFAANVDLVYRISSYFMALGAFLYHGIQKPAPGTFRTIFGESKCSYSEHEEDDVIMGIAMEHWKHMDLFFVCFTICYTACFGSGIPAIVIAGICFVGSSTQHRANALTALAMIPIVRKAVVLHASMQVVALLSCVCGFSVFFLCPPNLWPTRYRYVWHFCCMIFVYVGSLLNSINDES